MRKMRLLALPLLVAAALVTATVFFDDPPRAAIAAPSTLDLVFDCGNGPGNACTLGTGATTLNVSLILKNNGVFASTIGAFDFDVITNQLVFSPVASNNATPFDSNPDFNQETMIGTWACSPTPSADLNADPAIAQSRMSCFNSTGNPLVSDPDPSFDGPSIAAGGMLTLATVHYTVVGTGNATFSLDFVSVGDRVATGLMNCGTGAAEPLGTCPSIQISSVPSVGGFAVEPDLSALPARNSTSALYRARYAIGAGVASFVAALAIVGTWRMRRRSRREW